jgi:hypothetical protein
MLNNQITRYFPIIKAPNCAGYSTMPLTVSQIDSKIVIKSSLPRKKIGTGNKISMGSSL